MNWASGVENFTNSKPAEVSRHEFMIEYAPYYFVVERMRASVDAFFGLPLSRVRQERHNPDRQVT